MSVARLDECFAACRGAGRPALVIYLTVGDPSLEDSLGCARAALEAGADVLELGVPFSDPSADGPVIAAASQRAIRAGGSLSAALELATRLRERSSAPLVLFTYLNPLIAFGEARLPGALAAAGVDALLVVDLPAEEGAELRAGLGREDIAVVPLIAPTTSEEREASVLSGARGFVYYVSATGVTGLGDAPLERAAERARAVSARSGLPVVVGFGVDSPEKARLLARAGVDGVVVGSTVVKAIAAASDGAARVRVVSELVKSLRAAVGRGAQA
ncbi:MAG: tryptophan synthase subunit alpha [Polyangiaceae bacterium]|nr:tryptophan synthase subunit alpha [Polyangiaceae bacterium]MCL4753888.1 tryptophan synthase subunit alpha [Myxococcales bacterium]